MEQSFSNQILQQDFKTRDALTGAYSCALLHEQLPVEVERASRYGMDLSICLIDLDYFKSINDAYGHARGDQVLQFFAQRIQSMVRKSDVFFRYGGDEFVLLMLNANKQQAVTFAQRISETIKATLVPGEPPLNISLSIGVSSFPKDASTPEDLFRMADKYCYEAKRRGRGQVVGEVYDYGKDIQFDKAPYLIEKDEALSKLHDFLEELPQKSRGVLGITGVSGSGRSSFLTKAASTAKMYNYEVISLYAASELKSRAYGVLMNADSDINLCMHTGVEELGKCMLDTLGQNKRRGYVIVLDNLPYLDHATLNLLRQLLMCKDPFCLGLIYSSEPDSIRGFANSNILLFDTIALRPLSLNGIGIWVRSMLAWDPPEAFIDWLYKETKGLIKLLSEALSHLLEQGILQRVSEKEWSLNSGYSSVLLNKQFEECKGISPNNLPAALTEFIERNSEIKQVSTLLDRSRLVTLVGPGGIGKTRLALQVANIRLSDFGDGIFFASLASVTQADQVILAIAKVLNIKEIPGQSIFECLKKALNSRHILLILDSFEQVLPAAPLVTELLVSAPLLTVLVTSREALRVSGEHVFSVPSLEVPEQGQSIKLLVENSAVTLFTTRAQAVRHDFVVTEDNVHIIAELCARLEGIPLAIELAAANAGLISLEEMLEQSRSSLKWLDNGPCDLPVRHQKLRSTIEWSYSLLDEGERRLFSRLGLFSSIFSLEEVKRIIGRNDDKDINNVLLSLVNKSLLKELASQDGQYFEMLGMIREYAAEMLSTSGEEEALRRRHAHYYMSLAIKVGKNLNGPRQHEFLKRLEYLHSNMIEALYWLQKSHQYKGELKLAGALGPFWEIRGYWSEGRELLESIIERYRGTLKSKYFVKVYHWAGRLMYLQGDYKNAVTILNEGLTLSRDIRDYRGEASMLHKLGWVIYHMGFQKQTEDLWHQSMDLYVKINDKAGIAEVLEDLGFTAYYEGSYELAEEYSSKGLELSRELGDKIGISKATNRLGRVARGQGNYEKAESLFKEHLAYCEEVGDKYGTTDSLLSLAELARSQKNYGLATHYYKMCLELGHELGFKALIGRSLKDLGEIARYQGDFDKARELYDESLYLLMESGDNGDLVWVYRDMAELELQKGNYYEAKTNYLRSLKTWRDSNQRVPLLVFFNLEGLAGVALLQQDPVRAATLLGAADALFETVKRIIARDDIYEYKCRLENVKIGLDEQIFRKAWDEGHNMSLEDALDYAMEEIDNLFK
ncbi:MAG: diguanylate cyclase [Bacillota bacterium]